MYKHKEIHNQTHHRINIESKDKEKILESARSKTTLIYNGIPVRLIGDFPSEQWKPKKGGDNILKVLKEKNVTKNSVLSKAVIYK